MNDTISFSPETLRSLLTSAGLDGEVRLTRLDGGRNNRVYRVDLPETTVLLKQYFQHPDDPRDRLQAEFAFCDFAHGLGIDAVPAPLACDRRQRIALYEFIDGRALRPGQVSQLHVEAALDFVHQLNRPKDADESRDAAAMPTASEACFSIGEHLRCVGQRVAALQDMPVNSDVDAEAKTFVAEHLAGLWHTVERRARDSLRSSQVRLDEELPAGQQWLSPSDFGFHNALVTADGRLRFFDFEYAGWDDPAKLVCDFFCQPDVPVPPEFFESVVASVVARTPNAVRHRFRIELLLPVYQVKWCCILLGDFLPTANVRREFGSSSGDAEQRKRGQLLKAAKQLESAGPALSIRQTGNQ